MRFYERRRRAYRSWYHRAGTTTALMNGFVRLPLSGWRHLTELVPCGATVIDLMCGTGALLRYLRRHRGCRIRGVDLLPESIRIAKRYGRDRHRFRACNATEWRGARGAFDVVLFDPTLLRMVDRRPLVERIRRSLKPSGRIVAYCYADALTGLGIPSVDAVRGLRRQPWRRVPRTAEMSLAVLE